MGQSGELSGEFLDSLVVNFFQQRANGSNAPEEELRALLLTGNFEGAAAAVRRCCPDLADNQWLQFQLKRHQFMHVAALATAESGNGSQEERAARLHEALDLAKRELAPLALHAYMEAFADFKHCMLALVSGSAGAAGVAAGAAGGELREFAGMLARAVRQEVANADGACPSAGGLPQLLRYLLLLYQHQQHAGFHPYWWPDTSPATQALCESLLLPQRDPLPPQVLADALPGMHASGVREHDVQALRTSLGCDREEAVSLLRRAQGSAFRALQDALQATHIDEAMLQGLAEEYAASRGLDLLLPAAQQQQRQEAEGEPMLVDAPRQQQQQRQGGDEAWQQQPGQQQQLQQQHRPSKVDRKDALGAAAAAAGAAAPGQQQEGGGQEGQAQRLCLPAELSQQQLRQLMCQLESQLASGQADQAIQELEAADPSFLPNHPAAAFALHRCCFLHHLSAPGGDGTAAALAVVRRHLSPLAQEHPELLQPQLKAALAQLLPLSAGVSGDAVAVQKRQQQGVADALSAMREALRPRCHIREPRLLALLRELLSLRAAHFKLQRCHDRFAAELGIPALKAAAAAAPATGPSSTAAAMAAAMAAEAGEALAAAGAAANLQQQQQQQQQHGTDVPVPGVRLVGIESEDEDMQEDSEDDDDDEGDEGEEGAGVPEQAILTVCEFTGLPRHTAIELLLVHGGDVAAVLAHVFP